MHELLSSVFQSMERENICYCLLRDHDRLEQFDGGGEIDLLVQSDQLGLLQNLLLSLGFTKLISRGYAPHHFFLAYDEETDCWFKLDVVTEVAYGKPIHALQTALAAACLSNRRRCGALFVPSPEDELVTLLLHCVLDKGYFAPARCQRLSQLCQQVTDERYLSALLAVYWSPTMTWTQLASLINGGDWDKIMAERKTVMSMLEGRDKMGTFGRQIYNRVLRKVNRWSGWLKPHARSVALLAPDGAGKSTLATGIEDTFYFPVKSIYMGLYQKKEKRSLLERLPVPGLSLLGRLFTQWGRYLVARYYQAQGRLVLFDRYSYDALLPSRHSLSRAKRWRRWLLAHTCPPPDLVLVLDAPGEVLYARKGEHSPTALEKQRQRYLELQGYLPQMTVVDATRDADCVRRQATSLIWRSYAFRS